MGKVTDDDVERVRAFVAAIPRGSVTTGDLATAAGLSSPRIVGWIMRTDSADLPWHPGDRRRWPGPPPTKAQLQLDLLADDGVPIVDGRVLLRDCRWTPSSTASVNCSNYAEQPPGTTTWNGCGGPPPLTPSAQCRCPESVGHLGNLWGVTTPIEPPEHVLRTFGLTSPPIAMGDQWVGGWRVGEVVLSMVPDHARAAWSAATRENLFVDGLRIARPFPRHRRPLRHLRVARRHLYRRVTLRPRFDEVLVAERLRGPRAPGATAVPHATTAPPPPTSTCLPPPTAPRGGASDAHRARGGMLEPVTDDGIASLNALKTLAGLRRPTATSPSQIVHGDLFGTVLFAGAAAPGITDLVPYWRPASWAAAVVAVDALAWGGADENLLDRWADQPEWGRCCCATMFRLAVHALPAFNRGRAAGPDAGRRPGPPARLTRALGLSDS